MNFSLRSVFHLFACLPLLLIGCAKAESRYSFDKAPFINPGIVQDLSTWISDTGDQVVSINVEDSQKSNRYSVDTKTRAIKGQNPFIYTETETVESGETNVATFGYQLVGKTSSGIYVLEILNNGGGSGTFRSVMLVKLASDVGIRVDWEKGVVGQGKKRLLIKKLGTFELGDRWDGELRVVGDSIEVGSDRGVFAGTKRGGKLSQAPKKLLLKIETK